MRPAQRLRPRGTSRINTSASEIAVITRPGLHLRTPGVRVAKRGYIQYHEVRSAYHPVCGEATDGDGTRERAPSPKDTKPAGGEATARRSRMVETRGGKHVVKMTKPGHRPITLPHDKGKGGYAPGLTAAILRQAGLRAGDE